MYSLTVLQERPPRAIKGYHSTTGVTEMMLNVVSFLEKMGSEAQWNEINMGQMESALAEAEIEGPVRSAILNKDAAGLQALMQQKLFNPIIVPGTEEEEDEEEGEDEPGEKDKRLSHSSLPAPQS